MGFSWPWNPDINCRLFMDHRRNHFKPFLCVKGVRFVCRHDDHLVSLRRNWVFSIKISASLSIIVAIASNGAVCSDKPSLGEERNGTALFVDDHPGYYWSFLVGNEVFGIQDLSGKVFVLFFWHVITDDCFFVPSKQIVWSLTPFYLFIGD